MKTRIRHIARKRKGIVTESEKVVDKNSISIGRATDQDIFLADPGVSYNHARISILGGGEISVSSVSRIGFYVDGSYVQKCVVRRSGEVLFGAYSIKIEVNTKESLVDITVEKVAEDIIQVEAGRMLPRQLDQTWLSKRRTSWLLFLLLIVFFLGVPIAGFYDDRADKLIQTFLLPDDQVWLSGAISAPHQHFGGNCNACHKKAFEKVQGEACIDCHQNTTVHADPHQFQLPALQSSRCTICHKEHNGSEHLVLKDQNMCGNCHVSLSAKVTTDLIDIDDFRNNHPQFRASLMIREGMTKSESGAWERISLDDPEIRHETGLVFPHDLHLDPQGVLGPMGNEVMACADCHRSDASGNYMEPIVMEKHCQSCHRLEFDPDDLERELPHSDLKNLSKMLNEYYSLAALRGNYKDPKAPESIQKRRRPGKSLTAEEQEIALKWALQKAQEVTLEVVEFRSCNLCHKVTRDPSSDFGWVIPDVNTSQRRWLPKGDFAHEEHQTTPCQTCHAAEVSSQSEEVLLPRIAVCHECHGGQQAKNRLQSTCIECHKFHQPNQLQMQSRSKYMKKQPDG